MKRIIIGMAASMVLAVSAQAAVIDFEDKSLAANTAFNMTENGTTEWTSGDAGFVYTRSYDCCWGGFTYSNKIDTTTAGYTNDQSAITGDGVGAGQDNYAVGYVDSYAAPLTVAFGSSHTVKGSYFTNTTYTYLAAKNGDDGNDDPYVKGPFGEGDFLKLIVNGLDAGGATISSVELLLADGANVIDSWEWFDLTGLGEVHGISFSMASSDNGLYGMNTPSYFAMDNLTIVPVPAAVWLFASALGLLGFRRKLKA